MRKELQHALTQKSSICHDQLQQALRQQVCLAQQAEAMQRFESHSHQFDRLCLSATRRVCSQAAHLVGSPPGDSGGDDDATQTSS